MDYVLVMGACVFEKSRIEQCQASRFGVYVYNNDDVYWKKKYPDWHMYFSFREIPQNTGCS